jgi:hypothetical protein
MEMRINDCRSTAAQGPGDWIVALREWASKIGFRVQFTDGGTRSQTGHSCGPVATFVARALELAGHNEFMNISCVEALSTMNVMRGYDGAGVNVEGQRQLINTDRWRLSSQFYQGRLNQLETSYCYPDVFDSEVLVAYKSHVGTRSQGELRCVPEVLSLDLLYSSIATDFRLAHDRGEETSLRSYISNTSESNQLGFHFFNVMYRIMRPPPDESRELHEITADIYGQLTRSGLPFPWERSKAPDKQLTGWVMEMRINDCLSTAAQGPGDWIAKWQS